MTPRRKREQRAELERLLKDYEAPIRKCPPGDSPEMRDTFIVGRVFRNKVKKKLE